MFRRIVVAVDGSEGSWRALELAGQLARGDATVTVVHAYDPVPAWLGSPNFQEHATRQLAWGEELMGTAEQKLRDLGVSVIETSLLEGPPASAILSAAEARKADLIVMGTRGLTPLKGLLLGSVSERVIGAALCPVLITR
jgi:nucleotide-binding universal stress UspA family protein